MKNLSSLLAIAVLFAAFACKHGGDEPTPISPPIVDACELTTLTSNAIPAVASSSLLATAKKFVPVIATGMNSVTAVIGTNRNPQSYRSLTGSDVKVTYHAFCSFSDKTVTGANRVAGYSQTSNTWSISDTTFVSGTGVKTKYTNAAMIATFVYQTQNPKSIIYFLELSGTATQLEGPGANKPFAVTEPFVSWALDPQ